MDPRSAFVKVDQSTLWSTMVMQLAERSIGVKTDCLKAWLATADLPDDGRLPPERHLAEIIGVSRTELRKLLARHEAEGLLWRHVGKGTFLKSFDRRHKIDGGAIAQRTSPPEAMQVRHIMEPQIASLAARCATGEQVTYLEALCREMRSVRTWPDYQRLDSDFHAALARSTSNSLLAELHAVLNDVRLGVVWGALDKRSLGPPPDYHSFAEHESIVAHIARRDRSGAYEAMRTHLMSTEQEFAKDLLKVEIEHHHRA